MSYLRFPLRHSLSLLACSCSWLPWSSSGKRDPRKSSLGQTYVNLLASLSETEIDLERERLRGTPGDNVRHAIAESQRENRATLTCPPVINPVSIQCLSGATLDLHTFARAAAAFETLLSDNNPRN
ncbi:hypothetical protein KQX54_018522 [Cotesia glomerata]|uniref:Secreted protein n=1 Tax=Cotesia glomerata TaxID=32391 RepID=A0AAV7IZY4_COTGL|nr:hypothetical protein KQX54_018522 [Cotesia glomerata]